MAPLLEQLPLLGYLLLFSGGLTMAYSWLCAQTQTDIKTSLMFGTLLQTGLIAVLIGLGWYSFAMVYLWLHTLWRVYQFLQSPSFLQLTHRPAAAAPAWLQRHPGLYSAALHRFWLEPLAEWLLVRPTRLLAQDARLFDEAVIDRLTGRPDESSQLSTLAQLQSLKHGRLQLGSRVGVGYGLFGKLLQRLAQSLEWFEEKLVLSSSGDGLTGLIRQLGQPLERLERYLSQPRYLLVLVAATLVVIL
ncbi:MAG: proton-conducting transporter membrane subunit [Thiolinea sp.]